MKKDKSIETRFKSEVLVDYMKKHNLSKEAFAKLCDIKMTKLEKLLSGNCKVDINSVVRVIDVLNVSLDSTVDTTSKQL